MEEGWTSAIGSSSAATPGAPPAAAVGGIAAPAARVIVGSITMDAFMRSGAVQGYFGRNANQRSHPEGRYLHLFDKVETPENLLLSNLRVARLRSYAQQSTPFPTLFLYPALMGFNAAGGTVLNAVQIWPSRSRCLYMGLHAQGRRISPPSTRVS